MKKKMFFIYGIICYAVFIGVFLYFIGFLTGAFVPKTINSGESGSFVESLLINIGLISLFGLQHSLMARESFKKWWIKIIPKPIERSTYVLSASLVLTALIFFWQPMPKILWDVQSQPENVILWIFNGSGWLFLLISTRLINEKHLFGLQQVSEYLKNKKLSSPEFQTPLFYKLTRHPMMLGFLIAFWVTPKMSIGHLVFASFSTLYIIIGIQLEEKDLLNYFGDRYKKYREKVAMLIPGIRLNLLNKSNYNSKEALTEND